MEDQKKAANPDTEKCDTGTDGEKISLCASYVKNENDAGYTIHYKATIPAESEFRITEVTGPCQVDTKIGRCYSVVATPATKAGATEHIDSVTVTADQVAERKEEKIQMELDATYMDEEGQERKVRRKVILNREAK